MPLCWRNRDSRRFQSAKHYHLMHEHTPASSLDFFACNGFVVSAVTASQTLEVAHYVEAGVMTSIPPYGMKVPMLLGGAKAALLAPQLIAFGMDVKAISDDIGIASAIKMCRSVMIKGMEALVIESYATARRGNA